MFCFKCRRSQVCSVPSEKHHQSFISGRGEHHGMMEACMMTPEVKKKPKLSSRETEQSDAAVDESKQRKQSVLTRLFRQSKKEKTPTFTSYVGQAFDEETKTDDIPVKPVPGNKPRSIDPSPDPSAEESSLGKEQCEEKNKQEKKAEARQRAELLLGDLFTSADNLFEKKQEKRGLLGLLRKTPRTSSEDNLLACKNIFGSTGSLPDTSSSKEANGGLFDVPLKKTPKASWETTETSDREAQSELSASGGDLPGSITNKGNSGQLTYSFKKSPTPAPRTFISQHPLSESDQLSDSLGSLTEAGMEKKVGSSEVLRQPHKMLEPQIGEGEDTEEPEGRQLRRRRTIKKKRRVVSFRLKRTLPSLTLSSQSSAQRPIVEESFELQNLNPDRDQESTVEVQPVEMAAYPTEENLAQLEQDRDELIEWWDTVKGWTEWNKNFDFQGEDEEMVLEQAADRVYMAARLFVHLFNQRGASLQHRILELLALADAADQFHKRTVSAAVGGRVASVAGSIATITGLILAPFTFGASVIVTAVGIGVATAGSITSATANITDTVHSSMDRKKVEKMIQGYQEEIKDIRECLEFVQEGMDTLQEWDFEKYSQSAAKKALNHNIKHVMKEGGRAGKALMITTDKLVSTVRVLGVAGGAAKAARAVTVSTGVMSALFLALDVFFLAKESHDLHKGAKTKFAGKIREVCKDLQDGLLELNKVKTQLQKIMDGVEVEEYEKIEEVEEEVDDDFESDPKKLAELEQELDLIEEKLDRREEEEQKKSKSRKEKKEELEEKRVEEETEAKKEKKEKTKEGLSPNQ